MRSAVRSLGVKHVSNPTYGKVLFLVAFPFPFPFPFPCFRVFQLPFKKGGGLIFEGGPICRITVQICYNTVLINHLISWSTLAPPAVSQTCLSKPLMNDFHITQVYSQEHTIMQWMATSHSNALNVQGYLYKWFCRSTQHFLHWLHMLWELRASYIARYDYTVVHWLPM